MHNLRYALRQLLKSPGFTAVALLTLALCIGANVVIFAVVDAILLRPLPFPQADRLVIVTKDYPGAGFTRIDCSLPNYYDWRKSIAAFAATSAVRSGSVIIGADGSPSRVLCERVTADFFATLEVKPALGRFFTEEEIDNVSSNAVVLTDAYWRSQFNADPGILGRELRVDGQAGIVVGVLPRDFRFLSSRAQLYFPLTSRARDRAIDRRHTGNVQVIARLAPGASLATAQAQIRALDARQLEDDPVATQLKAAGFRTSVSSLHADHVRTVRPTLFLLQAGALALLLIGGVNLVNLLLIRASGRAREFAVRQALGASRRDVVREVLVETILLGALGGTLGLIAGAFGIDLLSVLGTDELPLGAQVAFDGRVAAVAWLGSLFVGGALAVPIIWFNLHQRLALALQSESRGGTVSHAAQRLRQGFIVAQIALAFMLLAGAGLLGVSLRRVLAVSPGFQPEHILSGQLNLPGSRYRDDSSRLAFQERLLGELRAQPGVTFAAISTSAPFTPRANVNQSVVTVEGGAVQPPGTSLRGHYHSFLLGDYWSALGIPLRAGRLLEDSDQRNEQRVCVVDEAFAQRYWPKGDAIGHRVTRNVTFKDAEAFTIVGVVGGVKTSELAEDSALGAIYIPYRYNAQSSMNVIVRTSLSPAALGSVLRQTVQRLDPELPIDDIRPMQSRIDASLIQRRSSALLTSLFAAAALTLAAIGTYGVLSYAVTQRRREFGIRLAIGAQRGDVLKLVLAGGLRLVALGVALGLAGSFALADVLNTLLFGVTAQDPGVFAGITFLLLAVTSVACLLPAFRATRVNPVEALRSE
jgi:predicted permease